MTDYEAVRDATRAEILRAFRVKPWQVGIGAVPRRVRFWRAVTPARWRQLATVKLEARWRS